MLAGLPYVVWPVGSVFILVTRKKDDPFLHYHAIQGLIWGGVALALSLASFLGLAFIFRVMPGSSTYLPGMLGMGLLFGGAVITTIVFFTALFLAWRATAGEMLRLPFAGDYAEQRMLDHTGMTRRDFMKMLEESFIEPKFDEPEPIPFPEEPERAVNGRAREILAQRAAQETTPASVKAGELLAQRQAQQAQAKAEEARRQAALAQQRKAAALQAQQAAALQASQRVSGSPAGRSPAEPPSPGVTSQSGRAKSYPLIGGKASSSAPPTAQSGQVRQTPPGPTGQPKVKDVDLVRHYKDRGKSGGSSDALKGWLTSMDQDA